jgi:hypothetical protein
MKEKDIPDEPNIRISDFRFQISEIKVIASPK